MNQRAFFLKIKLFAPYDSWPCIHKKQYRDTCQDKGGNQEVKIDLAHVNQSYCNHKWSFYSIHHPVYDVVIDYSQIC